MFGVVVDFEQQTVRARGNRRAGHGRNLVAPAGPVRRVGQNGQVRKLLDYGNSGDIQSVARGRFKGADSALAEDHVVVAAGHDVFGAEQPFLDGGRHTALQQHRLVYNAQGAQKMVILHIARAHLQNINVRKHRNDLRWVHDLADHHEIVSLAGDAQQPQALFAKPLEGIRRTARLESPSAQQTRAGPRHARGDQVDLLRRFHGARPGGDHDFRSADAHPARQFDNGPFRTKGAAGQLIGLRDANDFAHPGQQFDIARIEIGTHAYGAEHGLRNSRRAMDIEAQRDEVVDHILNLLLARSGLHYDNHELSSDFFKREKRRDDFVNARKLLMPMTLGRRNPFGARQPISLAGYL